MFESVESQARLPNRGGGVLSFFGNRALAMCIGFGDICSVYIRKGPDGSITATFSISRIGL